MYIFDGHSDIIVDLDIKRKSGKTEVFKTYHSDKLKKGRIHTSILVLWTCTESIELQKQILYSQLDTVEKELKECPSCLRQINSCNELFDADFSGLNFFLGIEGLASVEDDISLLEFLFDKGLRHASLTWNETNKLATGVSGEKDRGLTKRGSEYVKKLEELGVIIDVSHLNEKSFWDLSKIITKPIIASHSNLKELCDVDRNLTTEQAKFIKETGGMVGVNSYRDFVSTKEKERTLTKLGEHALRFIDIIGVDHLSIGFDFFEFIENEIPLNKSSTSNYVSVDGMHDASEAMNFIDLLKEKGLSKEDIEKIAYKNLNKIMAR